MNDGLCFRHVNFITQDHQGLMWFGTANGLSRYDGYRFVNFGKEAGTGKYFPTNGFQRNGALFLNDSILWTLADFQLFATNINSFETKPIRNIEGRLLYLFRGNDKDIWLISDNNQEQFLWHYKEKNGFEKVNAVPHFRMDLTDLNLDTAGHLWWSTTTNGLREFSPSGELLGKADNLENLFFHDEKMTYTDFYIDSQNRFFVYSMKKQAEYELWQYFPETGKKEVLKEGMRNYYFTATEDDQGNIWFGMDDHLLQLQPNGQLIDLTNSVRQALDFSNITSLFVDRTNILWIGTNGGLLRLPIGKQLFENHFAKKKVGWGNSIRGIGEDQNGNLFFFCNRGDRGLYRMGRNNGQTEKMNLGIKDDALLELLDLCTYFVFDQRRNCIWTIFKSLMKIDLKTHSIEVQPAVNMGLFFGDYNPVALLPDGQVMVGNILKNLTLYDPETGKTKKILEGKFQNKEPIVAKVYLAQGNDSLWVGTQNNGLYLFNEKGEMLQHYRTDAPIPINNNHLLCLHLDANRNWLWAGTFGGGLNRIDLHTGEVRVFNQQNGLPDNNVVSVLGDGDNLWIGTYNGLSCFNKQEESFQNFFQEDGLTHNEFNFSSAFKSGDGTMYFGGMNGINSFRPQDLLQPGLNPPMILTRFMQYDQQLDSLFDYQLNDNPGRPVEISPDISYFQVDWTLPNYFNPDKNQYFTWMEGLEQGWSLLGNTPSIRFNKLPPGNYTLHVKGKDSRGNWSEKPINLSITVLRPWWTRWWAYSLYILVALGTITFFWQYQLGRLRLQSQLEKEHLESEKLRELDQVKTRFFANLSHEFRTPLTVILGMSEEIEQPKTAKKLIQQSGQNLLRLVNQMLDFSKLEAGKLKLHLQPGDLVPYLRYQLESFESLAAHKEVRLVFEPEMESLEIDFDEEKIQHIVFNLLSNAVKFTPRNGQVTMSLSHSGQVVCIQVKDTGIGIPPDKLSRIFERYFQVGDPISKGEPGSGIGLAFTKELVELMGGEINVESTEGLGTTFTVSWPAQQFAGASIQNLKNGNSQTPLAINSKEPPLDPSVLAADLPPGELKTGERPTLLLIEDNPEVVTYIQTILSNGYELTVAENGETGIEKAIELIPDIIISDVMMPVKDGFAVTQFLKNDERTSHIPIVLLTAKADVASRLIGLERGADVYLAKPFDKKELMVRLEQLVELRKKLQDRYARFTAPEKTEDAGLQIEDAFLKKINDIIEANLGVSEFSVNKLCQAVGMSRPQLFRKLKALTDKSIVAYLRSTRLHKAKELLQSGKFNISEVAYQVGFNDPLYFSRAFSQEFGSPPTDSIK